MNSTQFKKLSIKFQKSKLSLTDFCRQEGVKAHIFRYWKKKDDASSSPKQKPPENPFVELNQPLEETHQAPQPFECILNSGIRVLIPQDYKAEALQKLVKTLS